MCRRWALAFALSLALSGTTLLAQSNSPQPYSQQDRSYGQNQQPYGQQSNQQPYGQNQPYNAGQPNLIPDGTRFMIRLDDTLDTAKLKPGKKFTAKLSEDLTAPDGSVILAGKKIHGHVSSVDRGMHAQMLLSFDEIETRHGWRPLIATVTGVPGEHAVKQETGSEGEIQKRGADKTRILEGAAMGAVVGAAAGAVTAGPHGAIIGAAAGGALGGGAGLITNRDLKLNKGTSLELRLDRPLQVPR